MEEEKVVNKKIIINRLLASKINTEKLIRLEYSKINSYLEEIRNINNKLCEVKGHQFTCWEDYLFDDSLTSRMCVTCGKVEKKEKEKVLMRRR